MYANIRVFNPKVTNNLDSDNNSVQSGAREAAPCDAYLSKNCHPKDGFCSLQGECIWLSNFHSNISQMELKLWNRKHSDNIWHWQMDGQVWERWEFPFWGNLKRGYVQFQIVHDSVNISKSLSAKSYEWWFIFHSFLHGGKAPTEFSLGL